MNRLLRLQLRQSEARKRLGELLDIEQRSEAEETEKAEVVATIRRCETDISEARMAEDEDPPKRKRKRMGKGDPEHRELRSVAQRASLLTWVKNCLLYTSDAADE